jgi:hypothetical protein
MARYVMVLRGATSLRGALEGVGPENRHFFGPGNGTSEASAISGPSLLILASNPVQPFDPGINDVPVLWTGTATKRSPANHRLPSHLCHAAGGRQLLRGRQLSLHQEGKLEKTPPDLRLEINRCAT